MDHADQEIRSITAELQGAIRHGARSDGTRASGSRDPLADVARHQRVRSHLPIGWPVMPPGIVPKLIAYAKKITRRLLRWYIDPIVDQQNAYNQGVADVLRTLYGRSEVHASRFSEYRETRDGWIRDLSSRVAKLSVEVEQSQSELATSTLRLGRLEHWRRGEKSPGVAVHREGTPPSVPADIDYFLLGALYRNVRQMEPFLDDYDDLFSQLSEAQRQGMGPPGPVLDIGCGRGELVAHLNQMGLAAYGIDLDPDAVSMAKAAERPVTAEDAFAHLSDLPDASLAAVIMIQVVEHLEFPDLVRLFALAHRKLQDGGFILAETINPTCLLALSNWYLLDPSHRTPLHPQMAKFLLEQAGFERAAIRFLHPVPELGKLATLPVAEGDPDLEPLVNRLNDNITKLNDFLYGDQDYAAIAHKVPQTFHPDAPVRSGEE